MKLRNYWFAGILIFMVTALLKGNAAAYNMAEYFPLHQGDEWTYSSTVNGITVESKTVISGTEQINGVETIKMGVHCVVIDSEGLKTYKWERPDFGQVYIYDPPELTFPAQFDLGDVHQQSYTNFIYSLDGGTLLDTGTISETVSLELVEDVTVPAGTFKDCLKILYSISYQNASGEYGNFEDYNWFARNVGRIKVDTYVIVHHPVAGELEFDVSVELTDYAVHSDCPATLALRGGSRENDLSTLREFRDEGLSKTPVGQEIIRLYYQWSPVIVKAMEEDEEFKEEAREMINGILPLIMRK